MTLPKIDENPDGFHQKYIVSKANGEPVDPDAVYFVLRIDGGGDDAYHQQFCLAAAREYCLRALREFHYSDHPIRQMAVELLDRLNQTEIKLRREGSSDSTGENQ